MKNIQENKVVAHYPTQPTTAIYNDVICIQSTTTHKDYTLAGGILNKADYFKVGGLLIAAKLLPWYT